MTRNFTEYIAVAQTPSAAKSASTIATTATADQLNQQKGKFGDS